MKSNTNIPIHYFLIMIDFKKLNHLNRDLIKALDETLNHKAEPFDTEPLYDEELNNLTDVDLFITEYDNQHHLIKDLNALQQLNSKYPYLSELIDPDINFSNDDSFSILKQKLESNEFVNIRKTF